MGASPLEDATGRRSAAILIRGERHCSNFSRESRQISLGETMSNKDTPKTARKGVKLDWELDLSGRGKMANPGSGRRRCRWRSVFRMATTI